MLICDDGLCVVDDNDEEWKGNLNQYNPPITPPLVRNCDRNWRRLSLSPLTPINNTQKVRSSSSSW